MVTFRPDTDNRQTYRRPKTIPAAVGRMLERTYAEKSVCELPWGGGADDEAFLRLCRLYATRQNRRFIHEMIERNGKPYVSVKMRDKRAYVKRSPIWDRK